MTPEELKCIEINNDLKADFENGDFVPIGIATMLGITKLKKPITNETTCDSNF